MMQMVFWYNQYMHLCSLLTYFAVQMPTQPLYTNWEIPWRLVQ